MIITLYDTEIIIADNKTEIIHVEKDYDVSQHLSNGSYITCIKTNEHDFRILFK